MTKPNILIIMVDQLNGTLFPDGPAEWLHAPNLKKLAAQLGHAGENRADLHKMQIGFSRQ